MPNGRNHRNGRRRHGAGHGFVVEAPQVLQRPATTADDQGFRPAVAIGGLDGGPDFRWRFLALHEYRIKSHFGNRPAPRKYMHQVAHGGAAGRSDQRNSGREGGQRFLPCRVEQAFPLQFLLQCLELALQQALAGFLHPIDDELVLAAGFVQADAPASRDLHAVLGVDAHAGGGGTEHRAAQLGAVVLQREVQVAGGGPGEVGDLAFHDDSGKSRFQVQLDLAVQLARRVDVIRGPGGDVFHAEDDKLNRDNFHGENHETWTRDAVAGAVGECHGPAGRLQ